VGTVEMVEAIGRSGEEKRSVASAHEVKSAKDCLRPSSEGDKLGWREKSIRLASAAPCYLALGVTTIKLLSGPKLVPSVPFP